MSKGLLYETATHPKTLIVGIHAPYNKTDNIESYYDEFIHLIESNNIEYDQTFFTKIREVDPGYFLTKGKVEEVRALCEKEQFEEVIISEPLSAQQERNLSELFHCRVFDRTQLILEIFEKSAHSAEGKLQVSIALLQHKRSRTAGKGIHMSQQAGHIGGRGPGETAKEKELRIIDDDILKLKRQLKDLEKTREVQRKRRLETQIPLICLMGYTNTGKSTLLNQLTKSEVLAQDRLFATLDTTTRELYINHKKKGLVSDTVGFIQLLPPSLIEAFKSTLDELKYADLLLHVVDISDSNWKEHIAVVNEILEELKISKNILYVFNKTDKEEARHVSTLELDLFQPHVLLSARTKEGVEPLIKFLATWNKNNSSAV